MESTATVRPSGKPGKWSKFLLRSALALFTLGLAMIGCNRSGPPAGGEGPIEEPYQAAFRVPGMS